MPWCALIIAQSDVIYGHKMPPRKSNDKLTWLTQQMQELQADVKKLLLGQKAITDLQQTVNKLIVEKQKQDEYITMLENRISHLEQYTRQDDLIITGLKTTPKKWSRVVTDNTADSEEDASEEEHQSLENQVISFLASKDIELK